MTSTAEPRSEERAPEQGALDRARGVELLGGVDGSGYDGGAALVRREDGQMVQLGPLMYALLECVDGRRDLAALAECLSERLERSFGTDHVARLAEKLAAQGLLAGTEANAPERRNPLLALRWKVLVTNDSTTNRLTAPFTFLFQPWVVWPVLALFAGVLWFVLVHKGVASATSAAFGNPELLLLVFLLAVGSAGFHEIGHAAACRFGGGRPAGMGMGLYMVWPAFYTDVTDAYRLARRDRLRVDLGGLYFNALVAVATVGLWLLWRADALLLLVALQLIQMVKQLSPVIRADGYHILSDLTGVPDLYAHIGPTLRRLLPWREAEPSALTGRARFLVTLWVLVIVPVLVGLALGAVLLLPRLVATAWESGSAIASAIPQQVREGAVIDLLTSAVRLLALTLPLLGAFMFTYGLVRSAWSAAKTWSYGRPARQGVLTAATVCAACAVGWAWWPAGQYEPIEATESGTLVSLARAVSEPQATARPSGSELARLEPGTHLALAMIPVGGASAERPAVLLLRGADGETVAIAADSLPAGLDPSDGPAGEPDPTTPSTDEAPAGAPRSSEVKGVAFRFKLPAAPGPGDTQAVAVGTRDGAVTYTVAYALVTVRDGDPVTNTNSAFAFANCHACTTVAVSLQIVLVVGRSAVIAPINAAGALNVECPACLTTAIARQLVVTLTAEPPPELLAKLEAALRELDALSTLGKDMAAVAAEVAAVEQRIQEELEQSGLLAKPETPVTATTSTPSTTVPATTTDVTTTEPATTAATQTPAPPPAPGAPPNSVSTSTASTSTTTAPATTSTTPADAPPPPPAESSPTTTEPTTTESTTTGG